MKKRAAQFALGTALALSMASAVFAFTVAAPTGHVNDRGDMLSAGYESQLESDLTEYEAETGTQIAVLTVPDLQGEDIEGAAVSVFEQWGIGDKDKDNGLLLMISRDDRKIRLEVGYGLEEYITDGRAGRIIREDITPAFKDGDYDKGVADGIASLKEYLGGSVAPADESTGDDSDGDWGSFFVFLAFIVFQVGTELLGRSKSVWQGGVLGALFGTGAWLFFGAATITSLLGLMVFFGFFGLIFDVMVSRHYASRAAQGLKPWWHSSGGSGGSGGGGGFGGFGGGSSGGGGASGSW